MSKVRIKMNQKQFKISQLMVGAFVLFILLSIFGYMEWKWVGIYFMVSLVVFISFGQYQILKGNYENLNKNNESKSA